jgi:hypothetical protein
MCNICDYPTSTNHPSWMDCMAAWRERARQAEKERSATRKWAAAWKDCARTMKFERDCSERDYLSMSKAARDEKHRAQRAEAEAAVLARKLEIACEALELIRSDLTLKLYATADCDADQAQRSLSAPAGLDARD